MITTAVRQSGGGFFFTRGASRERPAARTRVRSWHRAQRPRWATTSAGARPGGALEGAPAGLGQTAGGVQECRTTHRLATFGLPETRPFSARERSRSLSPEGRGIVSPSWARPSKSVSGGSTRRL